jgi:hypothetical protein
MDRRSLGVLTSDSRVLCEAVGAMDAHHRHGDRLSRCQPHGDRSLHPAADTRAANGWVRQSPPGLQDRGLIPLCTDRALRIQPMPKPLVVRVDGGGDHPVERRLIPRLALRAPSSARAARHLGTGIVYMFSPVER